MFESVWNVPLTCPRHVLHVSRKHHIWQKRAWQLIKFCCSCIARLCACMDASHTRSGHILSTFQMYLACVPDVSGCVFQMYLANVPDMFRANVPDMSRTCSRHLELSCTILTMPSDKHNLIMSITTGLISSLFNVALSRDVPFHKPQQLQCLNHGFTKAYLCFPLCSIPFSLTA